MSPESERSDQVVARVVAWHNRHPLATRITAAHVHSVGVVSLPFAVRGAQVQPLPQLPPAEPPPVPEPLPIAPEPPAPAAAAPGGGDAVVELVTLEEAAAEGGIPPEAVAPAAGATGSPPDAPTPGVPDTRADAAAGPPPAETVEAALPSRPVRLQRQVTLPPRPPAGRLRRWLQNRRMPPGWRALFSEDFIAPLRPERVARWAALHGSPAWPLEPEAPLRLVHLDDTRRERGGGPEIDLHVLTAAIGVGDSRLRLLLAPARGGSVIGPRHWSRVRLAAAGVPLAALVLGVSALQIGLRPGEGAAAAPVLAASAAASATRQAALPAASAARRLAAAASAPAAPAQMASASAPAASAALPAVAQRASAGVAAAAASAAPPVTAALAAASSPSPAALPAARSASAPAALATVVPLVRPSLRPDLAHARPASAPPAGALERGVQQAAPPTRAASAVVPPPVRAALAAADPPGPPASSAQPRRGRVALAPLLPPLADGDRAALREQGRSLRRAAEAAAAPPKAWALVTRPATDKRLSERAAAQLQALALLQRQPMRAELMPAPAGTWRAVFWPFRSAQDAEKVRLALADKGLRTEVVEF